jgi:uncharacterized protein involved in exopolysaccharide biosynthesis
MISELLKTVSLAKIDLETATATLAATEHKMGSDLAELRSMQDVTTGDSALRRSAEDIRTQLRENASAEKTNKALLSVLTTAENDPGRFVATPNRLLESHPSLRRLKDGLVDAQLRTSSLLGTMSTNHPRVVAAKEAEEEIGHQLHGELALARRGVEVELNVLAERRVLLDEQLEKTNARLRNLALVRAKYANQVAEVKSRSGVLERAEQSLAEARSAQASAKAASLLSQIDRPDAGVRPIGPGRTLVVLCGIVGGLVAGFGIVFLCVPPTSRESVATAAPVEAPAAAPSDAGWTIGMNGSPLSRALHKMAN